MRKLLVVTMCFLLATPSILLAFDKHEKLHSKVEGFGSQPFAHYFYIYGPITMKVAEQFKKDLQLYRRLYEYELLRVFVNTSGGDVYAAMKIGEYLRKDPTSAVIVDEGEVCMSSCVLIMAGATQRYAMGKVGIHRPYLADNKVTDRGSIQKWYDKIKHDVRSYLEKMNVSPTLADDMFTIQPEYVRLLSQNEQNNYGLTSWDPILSEEVAATHMKKHGYDKGEYLKRKVYAETYCGSSSDYFECYEKALDSNNDLQH